MRKLSLREVFRNRRLLTFVLFLLEIPLFLVSARISVVFPSSTQGNWDITPIIYIVIVDFILHFILYILLRIALREKILMPMIIAQLPISAIGVTVVIDELLHPSFLLRALGLTISSCFWFQTIIFGAFTAAISLFDRHTSLQEWKKLLLSFISATSVGIVVSWALWVSMEKLYLYMGAH